jgi:VanZ family protein
MASDDPRGEDFVADSGCGGRSVHANCAVASGDGAEMMGERAQNLLPVGAWAVLLAIVVLTVVPPDLRPSTDAPHDVEHAAAFLTVGILFGLTYVGRARILSIGAVAFCGIIEVMQLYVPGRHARWIDFAVDVVAAVVGIFVGAFGNHALKKLTP